jgi:hypothetical protein
MREYARQRGCALSTIQYAVKKGRITLVDRKVDAQIADLQWARTTDHDQSIRARGGEISQTDAPKAGFDKTAKPDSSSPDESKSVLFMEAKTRNELARAGLAELELRKALDDVVDKATVLRANFTAARALRDTLTAASPRIAAVVASMDAATAHAALNKEFAAVLLSFCKNVKVDSEVVLNG